MKTTPLNYLAIMASIVIFSLGYQLGEHRTAKRLVIQANEMLDSIGRDSFKAGVLVGAAEQKGKRKAIEWERVADSVLNSKKAGR